MEYRINEIRESAQRLLDFCDLAEKEKCSEERIRETMTEILNDLVGLHYNESGIEHKVNRPFLHKIGENIKFVEGYSYACSMCVLNKKGDCLKCLADERKDKLDGYYVYADSAKDLAKRHLGKEIDYWGHKGMVVGYNRDDIILSFSDGFGWDNIEDNRLNKLLIHSELNKSFMYVNKNIL